MAGSIANRWGELSGQNKWQNLLNPLDIDLRRYLIHYGEMAQATYDTFDSEKASKYAGTSKYSKKDLFSKVCLTRSNPLMKYEIVRYLYATSEIDVPEAFIVKSISGDAYNNGSNWIGYVAVATEEGKVGLGRRDIVVAWRGTVMAFEWVKDFDFPLVPAAKLFGSGDGDAQVHQGWLSIYTSSDPSSPFVKASAREQVITEVRRLVDQYKDEEISITIIGHSMGASLGTLNAADIVANKANISRGKPPCPVTAFLFASPHVGDAAFRHLLQQLKPNLRILGVRNAQDLVPLLPLAGYVGVGEEVVVNYMDSKYLWRPGDEFTWHNLEVYMHLLSGRRDNGGGFEMVVARDIALVNKSSNALKEECLVPVSWWCEKNKGMVESSSGGWKLHERENSDLVLEL